MDYDYRGGFIEAFNRDIKAFHHKIDNANRYSKSMYYSSSLDGVTRQCLQVVSNSFYGLLSLEFKDQIINSRYAYLKAFIRYRLKHYYNKEVTHE